MHRAARTVIGLATACTLGLPAPHALAAGVEIIERDGRVVELRGLDDRDDCAFAETTGVVVRVDKAGKGKVPEGFWLKDEFGEGYINLGDIAARTPARDRKKAVEGLLAIVQPGNRLELGLHGCGARAAVEKLAWVRLSVTEPSAQSGATATISGTFSYPSDHIPSDLEVCAEGVDSKAQYCTARKIMAKTETRYELNVPPGRYHVFARHSDRQSASAENMDPDYRAYYSDFVTCGLNVNCPSHQPIAVEALAGKTVTADPHDWYNIP